MTFPFNLFTLHSLAGVCIAMPLAVIFYLLYSKSGRQLLDLLGANFNLCMGLVCLSFFISDNLVPVGMSSHGWAGGPTAEQLSRSTVLLQRLAWSVGLVSLPTQLHFALAYYRRSGWLSRHIRWTYAAGLAMVPLVWTSLWVTPRGAPLHTTSSWWYALPWMPEAGPLARLFFLSWMAMGVHNVVIALLSRRPGSAAGDPIENRPQRLVFLAFLTQVVLATIGLAVTMFGYAGPALLPFGSTIMGVLIAVALIERRIKADRARLELERQAEQQIRHAHMAILAAREEERGRVARDLHDSIAQGLVAMSLRLQAEAQRSDRDQHKAMLSTLANRCRNLAGEVRCICHELYPPALDLLGLAGAVQDLLAQYANTGKTCRLYCGEQLRTARLPRAVEIALYRASQEAINNAIRHGNAERIEVSLRQAGRKIRLTVMDDGVGFAGGAVSGKGIGMSSMSGRIQSVGGRLRVLSRPGRTLIGIQVPCEPASSNSGGADVAGGSAAMPQGG